jgi:citrate synthase
MSEPLIGLEDVIVAASSICSIDGENGVLRYRGYDVSDLVENSSYEEVAFLLLYGQLPTAAQFKAFNAELSRNRPIPEGLFAILKDLPPTADPMAWLRTAVSALAAFDPESEDGSEEANLRKTIRLTAQMPTLVAALERVRLKESVVSPDASLSHASNFLYMLTGKRPDEIRSRAMDSALIIQADHEFNASTFAARVTVATLSDIHSGITSAVGTLKGPLHGGATRRVMEMLEAIGSVDNVESYIRKQLAAKKRIMGFGHRVYTTVDPRAALFKKISKELSRKIGPAKWYEIAELTEKVVLQEKKLYPNLDFYSASVYSYLGIPKDLFPMIFAISRSIGWCTHMIEQYRNNRIIRPLAQYAGPHGLKYIPIASRNENNIAK